MFQRFYYVALIASFLALLQKLKFLSKPCVFLFITHCQVKSSIGHQLCKIWLISVILVFGISSSKFVFISIKAKIYFWFHLVSFIFIHLCIWKVCDLLQTLLTYAVPSHDLSDIVIFFILKLDVIRDNIVLLFNH